MKTKDTINGMREVIQYLINHKDNQPDTEFCKNVDKLINLKADLANGAEKSEANLNIANVVCSALSDEIAIKMLEHCPYETSGWCKTELKCRFKIESCSNKGNGCELCL